MSGFRKDVTNDGSDGITLKRGHRMTDDIPKRVEDYVDNSIEFSRRGGRDMGKKIVLMDDVG